MTTTTPIIDTPIITALTALQEIIGQANAKKGFHDHGALLRVMAGGPPRHAGTPETTHDRSLRDYQISRLALIDTEVAEAIEELRGGRGINEKYYSGGHSLFDDIGQRLIEETDAVDHHGNPRKPEGVPSELADVIIRTVDLAHENGIDLAAAIAEKLEYNASRPHMHGKKA